MPPCPAHSAAPAAPDAASEPRSPAEPLRYDCLSKTTINNATIKWDIQISANAFSYSNGINLRVGRVWVSSLENITGSGPLKK